MASLYIFFYTLCASLPLLIRVILIGGGLGRSSAELAGLGGVLKFNVLALMVIGAFIVKFPIYLFHL